MKKTYQLVSVLELLKTVCDFIAIEVPNPIHKTVKIRKYREFWKEMKDHFITKTLLQDCSYISTTVPLQPTQKITVTKAHNKDNELTYLQTCSLFSTISSSVIVGFMVGSLPVVQYFFVLQFIVLYLCYLLKRVVLFCGLVNVRITV